MSQAGNIDFLQVVGQPYPPIGSVPTVTAPTSGQYWALFEIAVNNYVAPLFHGIFRSEAEANDHIVLNPDKARLKTSTFKAIRVV